MSVLNPAEYGRVDLSSPLEYFASVGRRRCPVEALRGLTCKPDQHGVGGLLQAPGFALRITWPDRIPGLKTWAGQQSLPVLVHNRVKALEGLGEYADVGGAWTFQADCGGASGWDERSTEPIDLGFSPNALGMAVLWRPAVELWACIGLESLNILQFADGRFGWLSWGEGDERGGPVWRVFRVEDRGKYGGRWGSAVPVRQHELEQECEFWPTDGTSAEHVCPECGSADCFPEE